MQRTTAATGRLAGALGLGLALPLSFAVHAADAGLPSYARSADADTVPAAVTDSALTRWRNYALASITPQFAWAIRPADARPPRLSDRAAHDAVFAIGKTGTISPVRFSVSVASALVTDSAAPVLATRADGAPPEVPFGGLERYVVAPSYIAPWGERGTFGVAAVLAYQRFASLDLGSVAWSSGVRPPLLAGGETSTGVGVRLDAGNALSERLSWSAAYQSRVNMDAFFGYRGVFGDPGEFDIPASTSLGLDYALTPTLGVNVGVERVNYGAITPFTSSDLPTRFLALLGNGASPVFAWRDLTVYSIGAKWRDETLGDFDLRYTTRQQPLPTSPLLREALALDMSNYTVSFGYARATGAHSRFSLLASYSGAPYFLGLPSARTNIDASTAEVEFQALWALYF